MMIFLLCMLPLTLAEPPVGDSYFETHPSGYEQINHQQYLPPDLNTSARTSKSFNALSNQYLPPNSRSISNSYGLPDTRQVLSQKYGLPSQDTSILRNGIPQEYGLPIDHSSHHNSPSSELNHSFSSASLQTDASRKYSSPSLRNSVSSVYGSPLLRSSPSTQYGTPQLHSSNEYPLQTSPVHNSISSFGGTKSHPGSVSQKYGTPMTSNGFSFRSQASGNPSQTYGVPARSLQTQYGMPSAKSSVTGFGVSASPLKTYGVPSGRSLDQGTSNYGTPSLGRSNSNTNAFSSSYPLTRTPSLEYGSPSSRNALPSEEYGPPQRSVDSQGYANARNALELLNQEPASYEFAYRVSDDVSGSDFGHTETRELDRAEGTYFVLLPDGTKQTVEYEADENGFKPRISVEPVDSPTAFAAEGPY